MLDAAAHRYRKRLDLLPVQRKIAPQKSRLTNCLLLPSARAKGEAKRIDFVTYQTPDGQRATVKGAGRCGDPSCNICGPKIAHYRAKETKSHLERWFAAGGQAVYFCFTLPRTPGENPDGIYTDLMELLSAPFTGRARLATMAKVGAQVFRFTGLEVTTGVLPDGRPDMHPHLHGLMLIAHDDREAVYALWVRMMAALHRPARLRGRTMHHQAGFVMKPLTVDDDGVVVAETISQYVHKGAGWGAEMELHGEAFKLAKAEGTKSERYNVAQMVGLFNETGDLAVRGAYRDTLAFLSGKRRWNAPGRWADTLAYAVKHGVQALNDVERRDVLVEGQALRAAEKALNEPTLPFECPAADPELPEPMTAGEGLTDEEIANAELEGGIVKVSVEWQLWTWICLHRWALGACVDAVRLAPDGLAAACLELTLERLKCPDGLLDCIVDVENGEE